MGSEGGARRREAGKPMIVINLGEIEDEWLRLEALMQ